MTEVADKSWRSRGPPSTGIHRSTRNSGPVFPSLHEGAQTPASGSHGIPAEHHAQSRFASVASLSNGSVAPHLSEAVDAGRGGRQAFLISGCAAKLGGRQTSAQLAGGGVRAQQDPCSEAGAKEVRAPCFRSANVSIAVHAPANGVCPCADVSVRSIAFFVALTSRADIVASRCVSARGGMPGLAAQIGDNSTGGVPLVARSGRNVWRSPTLHA